MTTRRLAKFKMAIVAGMLMLLAAFAFAVAFVSNTIEAHANPALFGGGVGSNANPFVISTPQHLVNLAANVNNGSANGFVGYYFILHNDLDIADISAAIGLAGWQPIGSNTHPFRAVFRGGSHTISGINITRSMMSDVGLFGVISDESAIHDLTTEGNVLGGAFTGGVVGNNRGALYNIVNRVNVANITIPNLQNFGGVVGFNATTGTITNSANYGIINANANHVGGIAGSNLGNITTSFNAGSVSGNLNVGGIAGANDGNIDQAFNTASITGTQTNIGGITGDNRNVLQNAYNTGSIYRGDISAMSLGGISGNNALVATINHTYNIGYVQNTMVSGGISGFSTGQIANSFSSSNVFNGVLTHGNPAINSRLLTSKQMLNPGTLTSSLEMNGLNQQGVWQKRPQSVSNVYFPELSFFFNRAVSIDSVRHARVLLTESDIHLYETEFVYSGVYHNIQILRGGYLLQEGIDFEILENSINASTVNGAFIRIRFLNYFRGYATKYFTILRRQLTIEWTDEVFVYNGQVQRPTAIITSGRIGTENITFTYEFTSNINAGTHTIVVRLADNNPVNLNYYLPHAVHYYQILRRRITISFSNNNIVFNGQVQHPTAIIESGRIGDENITFEYDVDGGINAGLNRVLARLADTTINQNYYLVEFWHDFEIQRRQLFIEWNTQPIVFSNVPVRPSVMITSGLVAGDNITFVYSGYENNINAGTGKTVSVALADTAINNNYILVGALTKTYTIYRREILIEFDEHILTFNNTPQRPQFRIVSGQIGGINIEFNISNYQGNINAGMHNIVVTLVSGLSDNFIFASVSKTYEIHPTQIFIEWDGAELIYNGQIQRPNAIITSTTFSSVHLIYSNYYGINAGSGFTITITASSANYIITNTLTYSILPRTLNVVWCSDIIRYNGAAQHPGIITINNAVADQTIDFYFYGYGSNILPGMHQVSIRLVSNAINSNYILGISAVHEFEILRRIITIENIAAISRAFDGTYYIDLTGGNLVGLLSGDSVSFILGQALVANRNAGLGREVITNIVLSGQDAFKYELGQPNITVDITRAVIDMSGVSFTSQTFTYNGQARSIFIVGELPNGVSVSYSNNARTQVGRHSVVALFELSDEHNFYAIPNLTAFLFISPSTFNDGVITLDIISGYVRYGSDFTFSNLERDDIREQLGRQNLSKGISISLIYGGQVIQPNGTIRVSIVLNDRDLRNNSLRVLHLNSNGYTILAHQIIDGRLVFYIDNLSDFLIVTDQSNWWIWLIVIGAVLLIGAALAVLYLNKRRKNNLAFAGVNAPINNMEIETEIEVEIKNIERKFLNTNKEFTIEGIYIKSFYWFLRGLNFPDPQEQLKVFGGDKEQAELIRVLPKSVAYFRGKKLRKHKQEYINMLKKIEELNTEIILTNDNKGDCVSDE